MCQILLVLLSIAYPQLFNLASMLAEEGTKETYVPTNEYMPPLFIEHSSSEEHTLDDQTNESKNLGCNIKICNKRPPKSFAIAQKRFAKMR